MHFTPLRTEKGTIAGSLQCKNAPHPAYRSGPVESPSPLA